MRFLIFLYYDKVIYLTHRIGGNEIMPTKRTPKELRTKADLYFAHCDLKFKPYTYPGLAVYTGIAESTLDKYRKRPEFRKVAKYIHSKIISKIAENALNNTYNSGFSQFLLKAMDPDKYNPIDKQVIKSTVRAEIKADSPASRIMDQMQKIAEERAKRERNDG